MTEQLQSMLREAADDGPELALRDDPWRRGRRKRLGRRLAGVAGAAMTVSAVVAVAVLLTTPGPTSVPEPAREEPVEPALPDTLYDVPPNIADISNEPLGEPAAVVYFDTVRTGLFSDPETRPLVVGAESGEVRAVREAGLGNAKLSPDGTMLAAADGWHVGGRDDGGSLVPPTVYVADMITGETTTHQIPDRGLGGGVLRLTWLPDSSSLAVTAIETTEINDDGAGGAGANIYGSLDMSTGQWREEDIGDRQAFTRDAQRMVVNPETPSLVGPTIQNSDGSGQVGVEVAGSFGVAFSPDGGQIAAIARGSAGFTESDPYLLEIFDAGTGELTTRLDLGEYTSVVLVGWGERGVMIDTGRRIGESLDGVPQYSAVLERIDLTDLDNPVRTSVIEDHMHGRIDVAAAFVDADTRLAVPPDAGLDWMRWIPELFLLIPLGAAVAFIVLRVFLRRRRLIEVEPAAVEVDEPPSEHPDR